MKYFIFILMTIPYSIFAQEPNASLGISGGVEYKEENTHAWNMEISYHDRMNNSKRFWTEFGINYSVLEYNRDSQFRLDTSNNYSQLALGVIYYPGYTRSELTHYSRSSILRFQAGANYTIFDQDKFKLTSGINLVTQLIVNHREHGQRVQYPIYPIDSLEVIDYHYHTNTGTLGRPYKLSMFVQPHIDASVLIVDKLWFTSRFAYYHEIFSSGDDIRLQLNLGVRYQL